MRALIVYGTTEGHTASITQKIEAQLAAAGIDTLRVAVDEYDFTPDPSGYSLVVVAASLHAGHYQKGIIGFVKQNLAVLAAFPSVFLSVSLSAASSDRKDLDGLADANKAFFVETGWMPKETHLIAGAFKFSQYDFLKGWAMKYIAWQKGITTTPDQDCVLTDWAEVERIGNHLASLVPPAKRSSAQAAQSPVAP
jgi:menaquinone-dependent protoporphyrinogen oxidase